MSPRPVALTLSALLETRELAGNGEGWRTSSLRGWGDPDGKRGILALLKAQRARDNGRLPGSVGAGSAVR
jgi:hypothetical protein